jgi:hypothetical protein
MIADEDEHPIPAGKLVAELAVRTRHGQDGGRSVSDRGLGVVVGHGSIVGQSRPKSVSGEPPIKSVCPFFIPRRKALLKPKSCYDFKANGTRASKIKEKKPALRGSRSV